MVWMLVGGESGEKSVFAHVYICSFVCTRLLSLNTYVIYIEPGWQDRNTW